MNIPMKNITFLLALILLPALCFAAVARDTNIDFKHQILSLINYVLVVISLISIRQFFWPGEKNRTLFHVFNMVFTVIYYIVSITFIINHQNYFVGFESLSKMGCIKKFFFDFDISMILQLIVIFSFVINIINSSGSKFETFAIIYTSKA